MTMTDRKMEIFEYQEKLLEFLKKADWETFDPVRSGLMSYKGEVEWSAAYQVGLVE